MPQNKNQKKQRKRKQRTPRTAKLPFPMRGRTTSRVEVMTVTSSLILANAGSLAASNYIAINSPQTNFLAAAKTLVGINAYAIEFTNYRVLRARVQAQMCNGESFNCFAFVASVQGDTSIGAPSANNFANYASSPWGLKVNNALDLMSQPLGPVTGKGVVEIDKIWDLKKILGIKEIEVVDNTSGALNSVPGMAAPALVWYVVFGYESPTALTAAGLTCKVRVDYEVLLFGRQQMFT